MMPKKPLEFSKVESLRKHMLLTTADMAALMGVSRMTYYGWVKGKPIRTANDTAVRTMLKKLLNVMTEHGWPTPDVIVANRNDRVAKLKELLK